MGIAIITIHAPSPNFVAITIAPTSPVSRPPVALSAIG